MKLLSIVGARPQFIKAAMVDPALRARGGDHEIIHTGQHYDAQLSDVFFRELGLREPGLNLGIGSASHVIQVSRALQRLEKPILSMKPDAILVYGDTNATLSGALAASMLGIPLAHVEAGLRSHDKTMPEERNRCVADRLATWCFCPSETAILNLEREGIAVGVHNTGDVMLDAFLRWVDQAASTSRILADLDLEPDRYVLATIHRDFNVENGQRLERIIDGLRQCGKRVVFPAHPRTRKRCDAILSANALERLCIEPVGYLDMLVLEANAERIVTDSGGVQKEAFFHGVPCVTVRPSTEWVETVQQGWNQLVAADAVAIARAISQPVPATPRHMDAYGDGKAAEKLAEVFCSRVGRNTAPVGREIV